MHRSMGAVVALARRLQMKAFSFSGCAADSVHSEPSRFWQLSPNTSSALLSTCGRSRPQAAVTDGGLHFNMQACRAAHLDREEAICGHVATALRQVLDIVIRLNAALLHELPLDVVQLLRDLLPESTQMASSSDVLALDGLQCEASACC